MAKTLMNWRLTKGFRTAIVESAIAKGISITRWLELAALSYLALLEWPKRVQEHPEMGTADELLGFLREVAVQDTSVTEELLKKQLKLIENPEVRQAVEKLMKEIGEKLCGGE